jgi:hypothetical protein
VTEKDSKRDTLTDESDKPERTRMESLCRELADQGKTIEAGWLAACLTLIPVEAPDSHVAMLRRAFYFGADHLFCSIMTIVEGHERPTEQDLGRVSAIHRELERFRRQMREGAIAPST